MKYAIVTGASKGIGLEIATELARRGRHLVLVARSPKLLQSLAEDLGKRFGITAIPIAIDLSLHSGADQLLQEVKDRDLAVDTLVNNAGYSLYGRFTEMDLADIHHMNALNIDAVLRLSHHFLPLLLKQPQSYLLNVSSLGGYVPLPYKANYGASKAYVTNFTRALRHELRDKPIHVCALCPGGVRTETTRLESKGSVAARTDRMFIDPDECARIGIDGLYKNKAEIIPGYKNRIGQFFSKFIGRGRVVRIAGNIYDPDK